MKKKKKNNRQNNSCYRCYRNCRKHLELNLIYRSWKYFMCLDIPPPANDILRITRIFSLAESILYFSYSVKKKKKKNHIFSDFLGRFLLNIDDCLF